MRRSWLVGVVAALALAGAAFAQGKGKKPQTGRVIVLLSAKTDGLAEAAKIKQIEITDGAGKKTLKDVKVKGKDQPRLVGIYVVKRCTITLADGKVLKKREALVAIEVGRQVLKDVKYVETSHATSDTGAGKWYAYTAEYEVKE